MWKKILNSPRGAAPQPWRMLTTRNSTKASSGGVNTFLLSSFKQLYLQTSKMTPPPKRSPPSGFSVLQAAFDTPGPVLRKIYGDNEEILITVMQLANNIPGADNESFTQLFLHVDISKPMEPHSLHFLCGLSPDGLGIHSVSMRPKLQDSPHSSSSSLKYTGPIFHDLEERTQAALHYYIEERGVDERLFLFLQSWLYVKEHRNLMRWYKTVGTFVSEQKSA